MPQGQPRRPIFFMGNSAKMLKTFPRAVRRVFGYELDSAQLGKRPTSAKNLKGLPGVVELVKAHDTDTYRAVYIATIGEAVFVLHCFKKKAKHGIATPRPDLELIRQRLREAKLLAEGKDV